MHRSLLKKKEALGTYRSPVKQFQSIITFSERFLLYLKVDLNRKTHYLHFQKSNGPPVAKNRVSFIQGCSVPSLVEIGPMILERIIFKFCFFVIIPLEKSGAPHLNKHKSHLPKTALCKIWLNIYQWFCRKRLLNFVNIFLCLIFISPALGKGRSPPFEQNFDNLS